MVASGRRVFIHGGAGSVGYLAVQLAKWSGADVIATASPKDFDKCKRAGAETVVDYRSKDLAADILDITGGALFDRIVDVEFGQNIDVDAELITPNGVISVYGSQKNQTPTMPFHKMLFKAVTIDIALIYILEAEARQKTIKSLHAALNDGALDCPVDSVFALSRVAEAHESVEKSGRSSATLIDVNL